MSSNDKMIASLVKRIEVLESENARTYRILQGYNTKLNILADRDGGYFVNDGEMVSFVMEDACLIS